MKRKIAIVLTAVLMGVLVSPFSAAAEEVKVEKEKLEKISQNCEGIREKLINVQHSDSRTRVYLGRYYETMLTDFMIPLNVWLVEHNKSNAGLIENQGSFAGARGEFVDDYIAYQKGLEELVATNCKAEPEKFYERLVGVRKMRAKVDERTTKLRKLMDEQKKLVVKLKEAL